MSDASRRRKFHVLDTPLGPELRFGALDGFSFEGDIHADTLANLALWLNGVTIDARMSSPSHDRAMAEGGWHDAYGGLIGEAINDAIAMRAAMAGEHVGDKFHAMNWQDKPHRVVFDACDLIDRLVAALCDKAVLAPPTPTTKEETA